MGEFRRRWVTIENILCNNTLLLGWQGQSCGAVIMIVCGCFLETRSVGLL